MSIQCFEPIVDAIVSWLDEGVIAADENGRILYCNDASLSLLGLAPDSPPISLHDLGSLNLQKRLIKAAIDAGNADATSRPSGRFVEFETRIGGGRFLDIKSGMVALPGMHRRVRLVMLRNCSDRKRLEAVLGTPGLDSFVTADPEMLGILERLRQIAATDAFVFFQGESGTGKSQLARNVHAQSRRSKAPLVEVNCAAIPESLLESELFGHVKGAFTGAIGNRPGRFHSANGGTLFLDEISEIPLNLQAKLLKMLQDQKFEQIGSDRSRQVDVRIIAASNRDLRKAVDLGLFRPDLYYRLAVIPTTIPPLRSRRGDIPLLVHYFQERLTAKGYRDDIVFGREAIQLMMDYDWPGNVRELANAVEHGMICAEGNEVTAASLPQDIRRGRALGGSAAATDDAELQRTIILAALEKTGGNRTRAAGILGIDRTTLWRRMRRFHIDEPL